MKRVIWTDDQGMKHRAILPDNVGDDMAKFGIPDGPPDILRMDWNSIQREINQYIIDNGLWGQDEMTSSQSGVAGALVILKRHLLALYREDWQNKHKTMLGG